MHFGLGAAATADVEVHWPSGLVESLKAVAANQLLNLREGSGQVKGRPFR
jgi:enediyne biosynthesis protein E4